MAASRVPPNAVDHVGSLKRPPQLVQAWRAWEEGRLSFEQLRKQQDETIRDAVAMQEKLGLPIVTDGEFRRGAIAGAAREQTDKALEADRYRRLQVPRRRRQTSSQSHHADALPHAFRAI